MAWRGCIGLFGLDDCTTFCTCIYLDRENRTLGLGWFGLACDHSIGQHRIG
jgi:hypothetical protein